MKTLTTLLMAVFLLMLMASPVGASGPELDKGQEYTVQTGDYLGKLAEKFYGDREVWPIIWLATQAKAADDSRFVNIDDPDLLQVGQMLWIPSQVEADRMITKIVSLCQGAAYFRQGQYQLALGEYNRAIEIDPLEAKAYYGRAYVNRPVVFAQR